MDDLRKLRGTLKAQAQLVGADIFGVADIADLDEHSKKHLWTLVDDYPRAISVGITLLNPIVDNLQDNHGIEALAIYHHHVYEVVNPALQRAALLIGLQLQQAGYQAMPIPSRVSYNKGERQEMLPHFVVANLAGLGWIGKNSLLITKQYGPRIGITTILTDAMLPADDPLEMQCGDCQRCVTACPAKAISGVPFHPAHALDIRLSSNKCAQYSEDIRSTWQTDKQEGNMCNKCVAVCPYGVDR